MSKYDFHLLPLLHMAALWARKTNMFIDQLFWIKNGWQLVNPILHSEPTHVAEAEPYTANSAKQLQLANVGEWIHLHSKMP